jgi:hypothetical protein
MMRALIVLTATLASFSSCSAKEDVRDDRCEVSVRQVLSAGDVSTILDVSDPSYLRELG